VTALLGELEVVFHPGIPQHDSIETAVAFKGTKEFKVESISVHFHNGFQSIGRAGNAQMGVHGTS
jgi:hypothetical protein